MAKASPITSTIYPNPSQLVLLKVREEIGRDSVTDWIFEAQAPDIVKKGDPEGFGAVWLPLDGYGVEITKFQLETPEVPIGGGGFSAL